MKALIVSLLLVSFVLVGAQESKDTTEHSRSCRIVFPERPNDAPKFAYLFDGKTTRRVDLPSTNFSEVISLPAGEITLLMTPDEVTENPPTGAPSLKISEGIKDFYIHVTADPTNDVLPLKLNLLDFGNGKLGRGETLWINLTDHEIEAKLGENKMTAPPKGEVVAKAPQAESGYFRAEFSYRPHAEGEFQMMTEQNWWHDAKSRHLGFIVSEEGKLPRIYFFRDFRP